MRNVYVSWWQRHVREGIRVELFVTASSRPDLRSLSLGCNYELSARLLRVQSLMPYKPGILRNLQCGAVRSKRRLFAQGIIADELCEQCSVVERLHHLFWTCNSYRHIRVRYPDVRNKLPLDWTESQWRCGLWPQIPGLCTWQAARGPRRLAAPAAVAQLAVTLPLLLNWVILCR